ncbi:hypothetical protein JCM10212_006042 [Sporobolomyces blumeae]
MKPSRTVLSTISPKTPRRRVRPSHGIAHGGHGPTTPPSRDLVGPPCPLSNLRPVYYAPLFPSLHNPSTWATSFQTSPRARSPDEPTPARPSSNPRSNAQPVIPKTPHPYSLSEFPSALVSSTRSSAPRSLASSSLSSSPSSPSTTWSPRSIEHLTTLRDRLHTRDLEYRLARYRFDSFNQQFWTRTNANFLVARERYIREVERGRDLGRDRADLEAGGQGGGGGPGGPREIDLAPFYAAHLAATKGAYAAYNTELWTQQARLIAMAVRDVARRWRWNAAVAWVGFKERVRAQVANSGAAHGGTCRGASEFKRV